VGEEVTEPILTIEHLSAQYEVGAGTFRALRDVSLELPPRRVLGIVGETGCGKSTLGHAIPRLLPEPPARITSGKVEFRGVDLLSIPKWKLPAIRGTDIGMIFQEPLNSLHPAYRVYDQIVEAIKIRRLRERKGSPSLGHDLQPHDYSRGPGAPKASEMLTKSVLPEVGVRLPRPGTFQSPELRNEVLEFLRLVRINDPERILGLYPHELSGGMRQRVMIAMVLSEKPALLIADEPTSALDLTIQAQVLTLMKELMEEVQTSILFISHDLGVIAEMADDIGVMYAGSLVELGPVTEVFERPRHPYTKLLLRSIPTKHKDEGLLTTMTGSVPNLSRLPPGCSFEPRCPLARPGCAADPGPPLARLASPGDGERRSACHFAVEVEAMS
jgi:peptide/nickel transport system ATP-binding protein